MSDYDNNIPSVGYTETKRRLKLLKIIAVVATVLTCLLTVPLGLLSVGVAPELEAEFYSGLSSITFIMVGLVLLIDCCINVTTIWLLYAVLKKKIEKSEPILQTAVVIAVSWFVPKLFSAISSVISTLLEANLENFVVGGFL